MRRFVVALASALAAVGVTLLITAAATWPRDSDAPARALPTPGPAQRDTSVGPIAAPVATAIPTRPAGPSDLPSAIVPVTIAIEELNVELPVAPYGLNSKGGLALPPDASKAAWYRHGGLPGDASTASLIAAHVDDRRGVGQFARLRDAKPGDEVSVELSDGSTRTFTITRVEQASKATLDIPEILQASQGELVLVTCGGRWNGSTGHYEDNVLAWASPSGSPWPEAR